jgi:hypothetical protein
MPYRPSASPVRYQFSFDSEDMEKAFATFCIAQGITTDAGWTTYINGLTAAQMLTLMRALFAKAGTISP